jgi:general secretion pathway protein F
MPVYEYTALDATGKNISGIVDAEGPMVARQKLRSSRVFPVSLKEVSEAPVRKSHWSHSLLSPFARIRPAELAMMTRQLATLVGAGFPLVSALDTLVTQTKSKTMNRVLARIKDTIVEGNSFAGALSLFPTTFSSLYINMVRAGETSGTLEIVLDRLADITERQQALKNRIRSALAYPILMSFIGAVVLFLLMAFIVPSITKIFSDMNQILPLPTVILIAVSGLFKSYWWLGALLGLGGLATFQVFRRTRSGRHSLDRALLRAPVFGSMKKKLAVSRFARTLGSLLENGVTLLSALEIVKNIVGNVQIADAVEEAANEVGKGQGLGTALSRSEFFPSLSIQMIQVGEKSGSLETMLDKIADVYENEVETTVMSMTALLEPVMILVMGVVVGFIVLSICLPIFQMNQLVR